MAFQKNHGFAQKSTCGFSNFDSAASFYRNISHRKRNKEIEKEREREKFILKWVLPNGAARRTSEPASWFGRTAILAACQGIAKGSEEAKTNKKKKRYMRISIIRIPVRYDDVCVYVCLCGLYERVRACVYALERVCVERVCSGENRVHTRLSENHFEQNRTGGENPSSAREGAQQPSRYHCSAASKLRRVHRLHTMRALFRGKNIHRATV